MPEEFLAEKPGANAKGPVLVLTGARKNLVWVRQVVQPGWQLGQNHVSRKRVPPHHTLHVALSCI